MQRLALVIVAAMLTAATPPTVAVPISDRVLDGHVVPPPDARFELVINVPQRLLFHWRGGELGRALPIAVGRSDWQTPIGAFHVVMKEEHPAWDVPVSIQDEMRRAGRRVITRVPPGPGNPLGDHWIGLSFGAIGLHGTPDLSSISRAVTHGCMRMRPADVATLYAEVAVGTPGVTLYAPVLIAITGDGVFLEVQRDIYGRGAPRLDDVRRAAEAAGVATRIDWRVTADVMRRRDGRAQRISME
jgi:L,D-transpeptidase ErfK/SrfK